MTRLVIAFVALSCALHACQCNDTANNGSGQMNGTASCPDGEFPDRVGGCTDDPCASNPCVGEQLCTVAEDGGPVCECPAGTHDEDGACVVDTTCTENSCKGRGVCNDEGGTVLCDCDPGYAPPNCAGCDEANDYHGDGAGGCTKDICEPNPCDDPNRTVCVSGAEGYECECDDGYHLDAAECVVDETCAPDACNRNGDCDASNGVAVCECDEGYTGAACASCDVAGGYHDDGMGGCTRDPCLPNPCDGVEHKTECVSNAGGFMCECATGYAADGFGGCIDERCVPNPCAAMNQACRIMNDQVECHTPDCDDQDPCTTDTLVNGSCQFEPVSCDDQNPCTDDVCDAASGCVFMNDDANVPDDGIACTTGTCSAGFQSHTPDDVACDDGAYCNGPERCLPNDADADADGCIDGDAPTPPPAPGPCAYYEACDESADEFPMVTLGAGDPCSDGLWCTDGDVCDAMGNCRGTPTADCETFPETCASTTSFPSTIDVPQAFVSLDVTVDGQPLPTIAYDGAAHSLFAIASDTGVWHSLAYWAWNINGDQVGPDFAERLMPGVYDIVYRKGQSSSDRGDVFRTDSSDVGPNGVRILQENVYVYAGQNDLSIDVPQSDLTVNVTVGGQQLPTTAYDGAAHTLYAVAHDTGVWHSIAYWAWNINGDLVGPNFAERLIPGTYDILYHKGQSSSDLGDVFRTDSSDVGPNGVRFLQRDVVVGPNSTTLDVDVPQSDLSVSVTVDGQALPTAAYDGAAHTLYAVAHDTGVWHSIAYWAWNINGDLIGPNVAERLIPGTYDILYRKGQSSSDLGDVFRTDASDVGPNGVRYLQRDVVVGPGPTNLAIDVPQGELSIDVSVGGQGLPTTAYDGAAHTVYAVAHDTGVWHSIAYWAWNINGDLVGPNFAERLIPGTYDIVYRKGQSSSDLGDVFRTDSSDVGPNGVRVLQTDVSVVDGPNDLSIDVPQTPIDVSVTVGGQPLPTMAYDGAAHTIFLVARDTGVWHSIAYWAWNINGGLVGPNFAERLIPGTYDIVYRKGQSSSDLGDVFRTDSSDVGPNGVRFLGTVNVSGSTTQAIDIDVPESQISFDVTVAGQALPTTAYDGAAHTLFAVARDTRVWHSIAYWAWNINGDPVGPDFAERLIPGTYDLLYRKGQSSSDLGDVFRTDSSDVGPNGVRYVGVCVAVP